MNLKGHKHEIFVAEFPTQSKPFWIDDRILGSKIIFFIFLMFGPDIRDVILYAHAEHAVKITKRMLSKRASKLTKIIVFFQSLSCPYV